MTSFKHHSHWISALFFASLFGVLLLFRTGVLKDKTTEHPGVDFALQAPFKDRNAWMNIYQNNRKIGFSHSRYARIDSGYQFDETVFMKINTMGMIQDMGMKTRGTLHADFSLSAFSFDISSGRFKFSAHGAVAGTLLTLAVDSAGTRQELKLNLKDKIYLPSGILQAAVAGNVTPGKRLTVRVFDPIALGQESIQLEILDPEEIDVMGQHRAATKLSLKYKGASQLAWVDEHGEILKEQGMLGITLEKTTRQDALYGLPVQASQDLTQIASIPSNINFADPLSLNRLRVEIDGIQDGVLHLHGGRQRYQAPVLTIEKENLRQVNDSQDQGLSAADRVKFLKPGPLIPSDHEAIQKLAQEITAGVGGGLQKARRIVDWIQTHIQKRPVLSVPDALAVLENRVGDCNEHAVLFAALARASGIPTRIEAGVVYLKGRFYYHAWNAVYIGNWITLDALFNQIPADVTHIRLTSGDPDSQLDILSLIGSIGIHVLDGTL